MWNNKKKALTFSFDDGVTQDVRLIELFNRYGLKATFNINSEFLGQSGALDVYGKTVSHCKNKPEDLAKIYAGHEIAVHTLTHPLLPSLSDEEVIRQVEEDRKNLEALCGYPVVGMAYPCGGVNNDARVRDVIRRNTKMQYARTIVSSDSFDLQSDLLQFNPTVYYTQREKLFEVVERFLALETDKPQLCYIWGHAYELDSDLISWEDMEKVCAMLAGHDDIFYGTNREVLLDRA